MIPRYTLPEMGAVWSDEARYRRWLDVELAVCEAMHEDGAVPREAMLAIRERASFDVAEIEELEKTTQHDVIAFLTCVQRRVGEHGRHLHRGMTSSDVVDTALSMAMVRGLELVLARVAGLSDVVARLAREHARTVTIGRTHGVHAEPTTFGVKMAGWWQELARHRKRLEAARATIRVGKLSGAVGLYGSLSPELERRALGRLGLDPAPIATQILQRDRHAESVLALAQLTTSVEKFALELRHLARTEVREVEEPFGQGQKGSSAMPHKRNPVLCERVCGLARVVRSHALAALEDVPLWHERDISHSSAERVLLPDAFTLADYQLDVFTGVLRGLRVFPKRMLANLQLTGGLVFSGRVLTALVEAGMSREEAYRVVQSHAMAAWEESPPSFRERIERDPAIGSALPAGALDDCFDVQSYLGHVDTILARALDGTTSGR
ncbi:MAG: adenylosuccinate lyase [Candidatus Wallbacteria bacterium]|nr:adenylosuccinate lyase [Candidatus Wallbacteria bacterium]